MLTEIIKIEDMTLEIADRQPWGGRPAIIASDGLFSFGADLRSKILLLDPFQTTVCAPEDGVKI